MSVFKHYCFTATVSLALLCFGSNSVHAAKLYKWVDKDGNISYQDSPPPTDAKLLEESELEKSTQTSASSSQAAAPKVLIYTIEDCDSCEMLMLRLQQLNVPFTEDSILDKSVQAEILSLGDSLSAPALKIGDDYVSDLSESSLKSALTSAGLIEEPEPTKDQTRPERDRSSGSPDDGLSETAPPEPAS